MKRKDPLTGEEFIPRKLSQRFATSANRIKYNNQQANKLRLGRAKIDKPLHLNHKILVSLMDNSKEKSFNTHYLEGKGFNFMIISHLTDVESINRPCIYEFMLIINGETVKIIKDERYKNY